MISLGIVGRLIDRRRRQIAPGMGGRLGMAVARAH
jgi:hypothetical protein